jgi:tetratricopeptide (TPR) repeat protein
MTMRVFAFAALAALGMVTAAHADSATPWFDDQKLIEQTEADVQSGGIMAVERHRDDLEHALANAKPSIELAHQAGFYLTTGPADTIAAMMEASKSGKSATAVANPYELISLYLGSYYDETGRSEDALRVLDAGLAISPLSVRRPALIAERGAALNALKRFDQSLADYDEGLKTAGLDADMKARFERGRGYALTELGRLDEAETAYNDSLRDAPGNAGAQNELKYIARLKAGAKPAPGGLAPLQKQP